MPSALQRKKNLETPIPEVWGMGLGFPRLGLVLKDVGFQAFGSFVR